MVVDEPKCTWNFKLNGSVTQKYVVTRHVRNVPLVQRNGILIAEGKQGCRCDLFLPGEVGHYPWHLVSSEINNLARDTSLIREWINGICSDVGYRIMRNAIVITACKFEANRDLSLR